MTHWVPADGRTIPRPPPGSGTKFDMDRKTKGDSMNDVNLNTIANIVTAVCAVLIAIKVL